MLLEKTMVKIHHTHTSKRILLASVLLFSIAGIGFSADAPQGKVIRLGMIGLDTSHVTAFTQYINDPQKATGCKIVAGFAGGSPDIESSAKRVQGYTDELRTKYGVEIVGSIEELCKKVDGILLESVDGRPHLAQARPVIAAGKPLFIDKPMGGNLADVLEIFRLAKEHNVPCWSSSSLRFSPWMDKIRTREETGDILGCCAYSPCSLEEHHPDLYWYGVHGVEMLFAVMGTGCQSVSRTQTENAELVVGVWKDGRVGTYRGLKKGKEDYGVLVFGSKAIVPGGAYAGYGPLCDKVVEFFKTGKIPVPQNETVEIFAFMSAADQSKKEGGKPVLLETVLEEAKAKNKTALKN